MTSSSPPPCPSSTFVSPSVALSLSSVTFFSSPLLDICRRFGDFDAAARVYARFPATFLSSLRRFRIRFPRFSCASPIAVFFCGVLRSTTDGESVACPSFFLQLPSVLHSDAWDSVMAAGGMGRERSKERGRGVDGGTLPSFLFFSPPSTGWDSFLAHGLSRSFIPPVGKSTQGKTFLVRNIYSILLQRKTEMKLFGLKFTLAMSLRCP